MDRFMDEAESVLSSRSASPYSQLHAGNSSPAAEIEKPASSNQHINHPKSTYQNAMYNRPITPSVPPPVPSTTSVPSPQSAPSEPLAPKCTSPSTQHPRIINEQNINPTQPDIPRLEQQDLYSSSAPNCVPITYTHIPAPTNSVKATDINLLVANTATHSASNLSDSSVAVIHFPSHLATAMSAPVIHAADGVDLVNANSLASVGHIASSWSSSTAIPLLDTDLFNNSKHGVFGANPNAVNQRTVPFAGTGYATGSIGQSVE